MPKIIIDSKDLLANGDAVYHRETLPMSVADKLGITKDGKFDYGEYLSKQVFEECRRLARIRFCDEYQPKDRDKVSFIRETFSENSGHDSTNTTKVYSVTVGVYALDRKVELVRETYRFFVKFFGATPKSVEAREKERQIGKILNDADVMLRCSDKVKQVLIYDFVQPSLGDELETLGYSGGDREKRKALMGQAVDRLIDLDERVFSKHDRKELESKLREIGVEDKDITDDIKKFFSSTIKYSGSKPDSKDEANRELLEKRVTSAFEGSSRRLIHGDSFTQNFLLSKGKVKVNDPEKAAFGYLEYDLATLVVGTDMPYRDKVEFLSDAYARMRKKHGESAEPEYVFMDKMDNAIIARGLRILGYYVELFALPKSSHKKKHISESMERMFQDVLYSAGRIHKRKAGGHSMEEGATYTRIISHARKYLTDYMDVNGIVEPFLKWMKCKDAAEDPHTPFRPLEFASRHPVGVTVAAIIATAAAGVMTYGALRPLMRPQPVAAAPDGKAVAAPASTPVKAVSDAGQPRKVAPPYAQLPGTADGKNPDFCKGGYLLDDDRLCVPEQLYPIRACDDGFRLNTERVRCEDLRNPRIDRKVVISCPDGYKVKKVGAKTRCVHRKILRR